MPYELLLFDADETLFDFVKSQDHALEETVKVFEITYPFTELKGIYEDINKKIWEEFEDGLIKVDDLKIDRFRRLFAALELELDPHAFAKEYLHQLGEASFVYDGVPALLERLGKTYRMAIITNGLTTVQKRRIGKSIIQHHFEEIVISEEIALVKPDPRIFEYTLEKLGHADKGTVLMVGDNLKSDILGGMNAGIDTCWLNPEGKTNVLKIEPTYEISTVLDLEGVL